MSSRRNTVAFVAPLPPPVNGFAVISERMLVALSAAGPVAVFNQAPKGSGSWGLFTGACLGLLRFARYACLLATNRRTSVYIALSGGQRQLVDLLFVGFATLFRLPLFIHHHSFGYLNNPTFLTSLVVRFGSRGRHIVLCNKMGSLLCQQYGVEPSRVLKVSNAAFVNAVPKSPSLKRSDQGPIKLGFLSNITLEKGADTFFEVVRSCKNADLQVAGLIAGPVNPSLKKWFDETLDQDRSVEYWGGVHGSRKQEFLESVDILVFPTRYVNEAEPVVILEAASAGALVIASQRGCIEEMIEAIGGVVVLEGEDFPRRVVDLVAALSKSRNLSTEQATSRHNFSKFHESANSDLADLLLKLGG